MFDFSKPVWVGCKVRVINCCFLEQSTTLVECVENNRLVMVTSAKCMIGRS